MNPDVVVMWTGQKEDIKTLEDKGIKVIGIQVDNFNDVHTKMEILRKISRKEKRADENFATSMFGEDMMGPWVSKTHKEAFDNYIKPIIKEGLNSKGFENITAYLYGDEMAQLQGYFSVGLPYCAGYACGYYMVKHYLKKTGKSIEEATLTPASEIME